MSVANPSPAQYSGVTLGSSFRDPSGFLFTRDGVLYRQVNSVYRENYTRLMESGLYENLVNAGLLIPHREAADVQPETEPGFLVLQPERVAFISYPYEWSFSQLKDAALTTLAIQKQALKFGMSLKDSSAYNIQFHRGRPVLIDTLSFEIYPEGRPWIAYRQFCQHFLAPLSLMAYRDVRLGSLLRVHIDGIPLDLASQLLPTRTRLAFPLLIHLHMHASSQKRYAGSGLGSQSTRQVSQTGMLGLIDSLESGIQRLKWAPGGTEWGDYYDETNYTTEGLEHKAQLVGEFLDKAQPGNVWDLGANTGRFSRQASERSIPTTAFDVDPSAVEFAYLDARRRKDEHLLPLLMDLTNPSPDLGWDNQERESLKQRGPADAVLALALIHHLAISNNVPLERLAEFFQELGNWLVIEFVPKQDSQVQRLLLSREDIFDRYDVENFEAAFSKYFTIHRAEGISGSERRLYLMEKKNEANS